MADTTLAALVFACGAMISQCNSANPALPYLSLSQIELLFFSKD